MEKFLENLEIAQKKLSTASHMIYVTFPLVKDKNILLKSLVEIKNIITNCINAILQYEYLYKRIKLQENPKENFNTFIKKSAPRYSINSNDITLILNLFSLTEKHKSSSVEFMKDNKVIILSENLKPETLSVEKIKEFLNLAIKILKNAKNTILS